MNTDPAESTQLTVAQPRARIPIGNRGLELTDMDAMFRFAKAVSASPFAPKGLESPEAIFVAVQMGMEIGLTPMAALQNIAVINGRPGIYGDAALALVRGSGLLDSYSQKMEGEGDSRAAVVTTKRANEDPLTVRFSVADAKKAGLWGKGGPWSQYPERMLLFRARGFNLRDNFGDVLKGLRTTEELQDIPEERRAQIARPIIGRTVEAQQSQIENRPASGQDNGQAEAVGFDQPKRGRAKRLQAQPPVEPVTAERAVEGLREVKKAVESTVPEPATPATPAEQVAAKLTTGGFTTAELIRVAINNQWCDPCDPYTTSVVKLGDDVLEQFLENWIMVEEEIADLRAVKGAK